MKRIITSVLITLNFCILYAVYSPKNGFRVIDETGYEIIYNIDEDDNGEYVTILTADGTADTLIVPDSVEYKGVTYAVCGWMPMIGSCLLSEGQESIQLPGLSQIGASVICLPKTLKYCWQKTEDIPSLLIHSSMYTQKFCVAEDNPYFVSPDGVVYTADMQTLIAFPMGLRGKYDMPEGVKRLESFSCCLMNIDTFNLAESVEELGILALTKATYLKSFRYTDNIRTLGRNDLISGGCLEEVILGSGLKDLGTTASISSSEYSAFRALYCLAPEPPELKANKVYNLELLTLFVPRASINLYEAHPAWGLFPRITSIEPPIVSGINEAEVTWVSNADATGYSWELYLDEERTVLVMRLTFNRIGQLSRLEFGSGFMSSSSPEAMRIAAEDADGDREHNEETTERQFTTYFSFTVENLSPNTQYYYTRKTYGETGEDGEPVVIDEEQSEFTTLSDTPTSLSSAADAPAVQKVLRNGSVYILNGDETYTLTGAEVK